MRTVGFTYESDGIPKVEEPLEFGVKTINDDVPDMSKDSFNIENSTDNK